MPWIAAANTKAGILHIRDNSPCQDRVAYRLIGDDVLVAVVADGAGSSRHAEVGANITVNTVMECLAGETWSETEPTVVQATSRFCAAVNAALETMKARATASSCTLADLRCTMLVAVATPNWVAVGQIGDGFVVWQEMEQKQYHLAFQPFKGEYANETTFVTEGPPEKLLRVRVECGRLHVLFLSSDGLEGLALALQPNQDFVPSPKFFDLFDTYLAESPSKLQFEVELSRWLGSPKISGGLAYDDKGVVIAYWASQLPQEENTVVSEPAKPEDLVTTPENQHLPVEASALVEDASSPQDPGLPPGESPSLTATEPQDMSSVEPAQSRASEPEPAVVSNGAAGFEMESGA